MEDRRRTSRGKEKRYHPAYQWLRRGVIGVLVLSFILLIGVLLASLYSPDLSGPAYLALINANLLFVGVVVLYCARKLLVMFLDRRGKLKGGRLHVRLLGIFGILAVGPAIGVTILAVWLLNQGIENWFSAKVNNALEGSLLVAEAYVDEHEKSVRAEVEALSKDSFWRERGWFWDADTLRVWMRGQAERRRLDDLTLVDESGNVLIYSGAFPPAISSDVLAVMRMGVERAISFKNLSEGKVVVAAPVRSDWWLVGQRSIAPAVLARVDQTNAAYKEYEGLRAERQNIRLAATMSLIALAATALGGAIWTGIQLANRIVRPVTALVHATNRVSAEDYDVRLIPDRDDELGVLTQSFNRMIAQLKNSRELLEKKNRELDNRRRVMEAVLTGVTSSVLSVDQHGLVKWCNHHAEAMLGVSAAHKLDKVAPELAEVVAQTMENPRPVVEQEIRIARENVESRQLLVRIVPQYGEGGKVMSVVVTADDITPLIGAQRLAAWRDVARRLAHEIKNPLTPIQLSAERIKRKYAKNIPEEEKELFIQLTDTIVRSSEEMRRMTNEFSDFARMPEAVMQEENLRDIIEQVVVLQRAGKQHVTFETVYEVEPEATVMMADRGQIARVFVNLLENAAQAIAEREGTNLSPGLVKIVVKKTQTGMLATTVLDNGRGLPKDVEVEKLFDPYVTTRKTGTGLGLAIVRRVVDEHDGQIRLSRRAEGGTAVEVVFPALTV